MKNLLFAVSLMTSLFTLIPFKALAGGETLSPNMNLIVPAVGITTGPQWAADIDMSLSLIDSHDHSPGHGVQITPSGLNINADLSCQNSSVTNIKSTNYTAQSSAPSAGSVYMSGVDLYFVDLNGNNIRLTQSGSISGSAGSITGLVPPASASYVPGNQTFTWQSGVSTAANMDLGCILQRDITVNSNAITVCPPANLPSNFTLTWPSILPGSSTAFMTMDTAGNIGTTPPNASVTSSSSGVFATTFTSLINVSNLHVSIGTTGRPVILSVQSDGSGNVASIGGISGCIAQFQITRDSTPIADFQINDSTESAYHIPGMTFIDIVGSGLHTYQLKARCVSTGTLQVNYSTLTAYQP